MARKVIQDSVIPARYGFNHLLKILLILVVLQN